MERFPHLFQPFALGGLTLRNRITITAHTTNLSADGVPGAAERAYYARRARGGAALLVTEGMAVHPTGVSGRTTWRAYAPALVGPLAALGEAVHADGAGLIGQLRHNGRQMKSQPGGPPLWAPSALPSAFFRETPHAMSLAEIDELGAGFVLGAQHVLRAGLDGVEINAAHGFLLHGFLSPRANQRTDAYGGSEENRWRLPLAVCAAVRAAVGRSLVVGVRLSAEDGSPGGMEWPMVARFARALAATGWVSYVSLTHSDFEPWSISAMVPDPVAGVPDMAAMAAIRRAVPELPLIVAGGIRDPEMAEHVLATGTADLVGMTRALIAEPDLPRLVRDGQRASVRPCIACNECWAAVGKGAPIRCTVAPDAGREADAPVRPATGQRVVVVGGGVAGMYAAREAARHGCRVTLLEADSMLGGQTRLIAESPGGELLGRLLVWLAGELERLDIELRLGITAAPHSVRALSPDRLILALGAADPVRPIFPTSGSVVTSAQLLARGSAPSACLVVDGDQGLEALRIAEQVAQWGSKVTLITEQLAPGSEAPSISVMSALARLHRLHVPMLTTQRVLAYDGETVTLQDVLTGESSSLHGIAEVIVTGGRVARTSDWQEHTVKVGDCLAPRTLAHAIRDGYNAGWSV